MLHYFVRQAEGSSRKARQDWILVCYFIAKGTKISKIPHQNEMMDKGKRGHSNTLFYLYKQRKRFKDFDRGSLKHLPEYSLNTLSILLVDTPRHFSR